MTNQPYIRAIIDEAVAKAIEAGRLQESSMADDAFKATERRLYALPALKKKVESDKKKLAHIVSQGPHDRSKSLIRLQRSDYCVDPETMFAAITLNIKARIAKDEYEIETVVHAMESYDDDPFYPTVTGKYIDKYDDEDIAADLGCGTTLVWKHRTRIVRNIAIMLYGVLAV